MIIADVVCAKAVIRTRDKNEMYDVCVSLFALHLSQCGKHCEIERDWRHVEIIERGYGLSGQREFLNDCSL